MKLKEKLTQSLKKLHFRREDMERVLIVCAAGLVVALALRTGDQPQTMIVYEEPPMEAAMTAAQPDVEMQTITCWYEDGDGYLVPVTREIPRQDGIAKATLSLMVESSQNDLAAARLGLTNVIPEGTTFEIDIADGHARIDMSSEALNCASAEEELLMVGGTAAALCCFDTVDDVTFLFDGQKRSQLTHGTDVSGVFSIDNVNVESISVSSDSYAGQVQLYFPSASGRMLVPVTRTVFSTADLSTALLELAKGPQKDSGLDRPLPEDCGVRAVSLKDGLVTIDFTKEFASVANQADGGLQAVRAIMFTAGQFPGVKEVRITVEGKPFEPEPEAQTTFINMADEVMASYPGVIEID